MQRISAKDARSRLTDVLEEATFRGGRFLITRNGRPMAVLIGHDDLVKLCPSLADEIFATGKRVDTTLKGGEEAARDALTRIVTR
jgi:prevent-host-death family protein